MISRPTIDKSKPNQIWTYATAKILSVTFTWPKIRSVMISWTMSNERVRAGSFLREDTCGQMAPGSCVTISNAIQMTIMLISNFWKFCDITSLRSLIRYNWERDMNRWIKESSYRTTASDHPTCHLPCRCEQHCPREFGGFQRNWIALPFRPERIPMLQICFRWSNRLQVFRAIRSLKCVHRLW